MKRKIQEGEESKEDILVAPPKKKRCVVKHSDETQLHFLEAAMQFGVTRAARQYGVPTTTAYRWMKAWDPVQGKESVQRKKPGPAPGNKRKLTPEITSFIDDLCTKSNTLTGKEIANIIREERGVRIGRSTINGYIAQKDITYKASSQEDISRNNPVIIEERYQFAKRMLEEGERPDDPNLVVYWDITYFETCAVRRRARSKKNTPAVVPKGHRGVYFNKDESRKKKKSQRQQEKEKEEEGTKPEFDVEFTAHEPVNFNGGKANSLACICAITGKQVLLARTQFRHPNSADCVEFFKELLEKLNKEDPKRGYTFFGDNENVYGEMKALFLLPENQHHTLIPNPRFSPFLNAIEYLFKQVKDHISGQQHKRIGDILTAVQKGFEFVQPENLLNYHKIVSAYLAKALQREEIHSWRLKLPREEKEKVPVDPPKQKWDVKHRTIFSTERSLLSKPLAKHPETNPVKPSYAEMIKNGVRLPLYPTNP